MQHTKKGVKQPRSMKIRKREAREMKRMRRKQRKFEEKDPNHETANNGGARDSKKRSTQRGETDRKMVCRKRRLFGTYNRVP